jgi:hypothetical protein
VEVAAAAGGMPWAHDDRIPQIQSHFLPKKRKTRSSWTLTTVTAFGAAVWSDDVFVCASTTFANGREVQVEVRVPVSASAWARV